MDAQQRETERGNVLLRFPSFILIPKEILKFIAVDFEPEFGRLAPVVFLDGPDIVEIDNFNTLDKTKRAFCHALRTEAGNRLERRVLAAGLSTSELKRE